MHMLGMLILSLICAMTSAVMTFLMGHTIWLAILAYVLVGNLVVALCVVGMLIVRRRRDQVGPVASIGPRFFTRHWLE